MKPTREIKKKVIEELYDKIHDKLGVCGHCGKHDCGGRSSHSVLPESISSSKLIEITDKIIE